ILLDEPTNAIDEEGINSIRNLLLKEKDRGATIVIASHNKEDLTILADKKIIMNSGEIVDND
ncbi:multidrug ABC transporter ATP-binding protein, partial [Priestia megaterium]